MAQSRSVPRPLAVGLAGVLLLIAGGIVWMFLGRAPQTVGGQGVLVPKKGFDAVYATTSGDVQAVTVKPGDTLRPSTVVAWIRRPDGRTVRQRAEASGLVTTTLVQPGEYVGGVAPLISFAPENEPLVVLTIVDSRDAEKVEAGMKALVSLPSFPAAQNGSIEGTVVSSNAIPLSRERLLVLLAGNSGSTDQILADGPVSEVYVSLDTTLTSPSGYEWTVGNGPVTEIDLGTITDVEIELSDDRIVRAITG